MISIESHRARIGLFQNGKSKQKTARRSSSDLIANKNEQFSSYDGEARIYFTKKQSYFLIALCFVFMSLLCFDTNANKHSGVAHDNSSWGYEKLSCGLQVLSKSQKLLCTNCKEISISYTTPKSVLDTNLLIGNIEPNPGPTYDLKGFLGFLYTGTNDANVKVVLNDFKASQDRATNLQKMKQKKLEDLKATLAYLNNWNMEEKNTNEEEIDNYNKFGIATIVTKNIYNMAPEDCSSCNNSYYFKPGEHCILTCLRCNRGACSDCYEKEQNIINSSSIFYSSTFFACTSCRSLILNQDNEEKIHLRRTKTPSHKYCQHCHCYSRGYCA